MERGGKEQDTEPRPAAALPWGEVPCAHIVSLARGYLNSEFKLQHIPSPLSSLSHRQPL